VGTAALREKTMAFSSIINVIAAFVVSFTLPYLLNPPFANLQARVGYIYGALHLSSSPHNCPFDSSRLISLLRTRPYRFNCGLGNDLCHLLHA
jgi:hypothetical protein